MKKFFTYFLTAFATLFFMNYLLSGFGLSADLLEVLVMALAITAGIYIAQQIINRSSRNAGWVFILLVSLVNFFMIYIAALLLPGTDVTGGALLLNDLGIVSAPNQSVDVILTLLIAGLISGLIAQLTRWSAMLSD